MRENKRMLRMKYKIRKNNRRIILGSLVIAISAVISGCENYPMRSILEPVSGIQGTSTPQASPTQTGTGTPTPQASPTQTSTGIPTPQASPTSGSTAGPTEGLTPENTPTSQTTPTPQSTVTPTPQTTPVPQSTSTPLPQVSLTPELGPTPEEKPLVTGEVVFSKTEYFLPCDTDLCLSITSGKSGQVYYTLDGSEPMEDDMQYTEPIRLKAGESGSPNVYTIRTKAIYDDETMSPTYVHTYFVGKEIEKRYTTCVFSINGDPAELTGEPDGILYGTNYEQRGAASERKVHIEALAPDGELLFSQYSGVRVYGGTSREHPVKSLKLYARKRYEPDQGTFAFDAFGSMTADESKRITKYDKLVLRNGGDDFQRSFIRDELMQRLASGAGFQNYEAVVPALAYMNGEYYGFYWLHESYCDKYFQNRNGKSEGEYIVLEGSDQYKSHTDDVAETNAAKTFNSFYASIVQTDLTVEENYQKLCDFMDVNNYLDYMSYNMYIANYDWPQGNFRCFRYYAAPGETYGEGERDGRWRFLLHDMDVGLGTYLTGEDAGANKDDIKEVLSPKNQRYSALLSAILKREDCRQYFIDRMNFYSTEALSPKTTSAMLNQLISEREAELKLFIQHLETLKGTAVIYASEAAVKKHEEKIRTFFEKRPEYIYKYLKENLTY